MQFPISMRLVAEKKTRYAQTAPTPPRLLPCIGDRGCIVGEKSGGDPCRVKIHRIKPDLRYVNGSGKVIVHPHPAPDQHQNLTTSGGLTLVVTSIVSYPAHEQNERQNDRTKDHITPPALTRESRTKCRGWKCRTT